MNSGGISGGGAADLREDIERFPVCLHSGEAPHHLQASATVGLSAPGGCSAEVGPEPSSGQRVDCDPHRGLRLVPERGEIHVTPVGSAPAVVGEDTVHRSGEQ